MSEKSLPSRAERVTFFEDRAEVIRKLTCKVAAGLSRLSIDGVSAAIDDSSLIARANNGVRVLQSRVLRRVRQAAAADEDTIRAMEADARQSRERRAADEREAAAAGSEAERFEAMIEGWREAMSRVPRGGLTAVSEWGRSRSEVEFALLRALDALAKAKLSLAHSRNDETRAETRLAIGRALHPRYETQVEVQLEAPGDCEVEIELCYRTPCALWRPEHLVRLLPGDSPRLEITTFATVWQISGEKWIDVTCRFSTARPAQSASPPLLGEDVLRLRPKSDEEKRRVQIQARDQAVNIAGLDRGARMMEEMPGVDDGGEPLSFEASPATLPSDGQPFRVEIGSRTLPCKLDNVAYPERSERAHLRATATLSGGLPLLAGPVWLARGSEMVGHGKINFVAAGEPFEIGLGAEEALTVRRKPREEREVTLLGTQKIARTVELYLSNTGGRAQRLRVTERIPVSELADLKIELVRREGATFDRKDGLVHFDVELDPRGTQKLELGYKIEAPSKLVLPF